MQHLNYKTILFLAFCCISINASSQTSDERIKNYIAEANKAEGNDDYMAIMNSADSFARKTNDVAAQALVNQNIGNHYYTTDADECIKYLTKANRLFLTAGDKHQAGICLNNMAFACQEQKKDYVEAMKYTRRAINLWTELKDTLGQANMYKYACMLNGKMHDMNQAKRNANTALQLYGAKGDKSGTAVTYRNLGIAYEEAGEYDSSIKFMEHAIETWKTSRDKPDQSRIYIWNNDLIRVYSKAGSTDEGEAKIAENQLTDATNFYYTDVLAFYKEASAFYSKKKDKENAKEYREKYNAMRDNLKAEGKIVD